MRFRGDLDQLTCEVQFQAIATPTPILKLIKVDQSLANDAMSLRKHY
ncbi:hypothetical protein SPLC1_S208400 [Arthrospira platensis C1]|uniref:Uncharacterized protein n=3 Tax=Sirenicapillariaceae TaxID=2934961 RepID=A0A9P1P1H5_9CYAN|nr:hypothetical protein AmaxDRAFT_5106 [Limnospira maxima CS-328]EKD09435.1 hypothetical protein SPLC1_S208400 [Arthrospira platensis C1]UWU46401.1 hypothetical protein APLC1_1111 [Arthrospira platensis C1]CDM97704.1 conserved protein of unknown function [Limnospira indica PCC 8005]